MKLNTECCILYFVLYSRCQHRGALMADSYIEGDNIICGGAIILVAIIGQIAHLNEVAIAY